MNHLVENYTYSFVTSGQGSVELEHVNSMKDLGVCIDGELTFKEHIYDKINKAYQMLGIINRNFKDLNGNCFILLYKCLVRSQMEYANVVWNPYKKSFIEDIERVQKRATKMVKSLRKLSYKERLIRLKLPTLKFRRMRGDMIDVFKILTGRYDSDVSPVIPKCEYLRTRGNSMKLKTIRARYDLRKFSFTVRIVNIWNSLPDSVISADSINIFKNKLDKHWMSEDVYYDYEADLIGSQ